jgi:molybdopterin-guanine dinucleotide biosynthesis protein A
MVEDKPGVDIGGLVLAGGRSTRFGAEKAAALLQGQPLLSWALDHLALSAGARAVSAAAGSQAETLARAAGVPVLRDADGDARGPLSGIRAGLVWARELGLTYLAVEPCDAPLLPRDLHLRLRAAIGDAPAAVAETPDGVQPLCSLWRTDVLDAVTAALAGGAHPPIWRLLGDLGAARVAFGDASAFANTNRPQDLEAAALRLR